MEKLEVRVVAQDGVPVERHWHAVFGIAGGTIGRGGQNKLIITDPASLVARVHAMVRLDSQGAFIANLSDRKSIWVADLELRSGEEAPIPLGAPIRINPYVLQAVAPGTPFVSTTAAPLPMAAPGVALGSAQSLPPVESVSPALVAQPSPAAPASALPQASEVASPPAPNAGKPRSIAAANVAHRPLIPADFDPFAHAPDQPRSTQGGWEDVLPEHPLDVLDPRPRDGLIRDLPLNGSGTPTLDDSSHRGLPPGLETSPILDPLALFDGSALLPDAQATAPASARGAELDQMFNLPKIQAGAKPPEAAATPPVPAPDILPPDIPSAADLPVRGSGEAAPPAAAPADRRAPETARTQTAAPAPAVDARQQAAALDSLAQAFIEGAGLDRAKVQFQVTPEFMRTFGEALRIAVQGTIDLLAARSEIKREFRAGATVIASGANNPLKFLPNANGVIMQMVQQSFPGFMKPLPAMEDAYQDLRIHQLALMAGIRAAYAEALSRFDPGALERRAEGQPGLLDKILTNGRKAALWDDYKHSFDTLRRHAEDDLAAFSGRTFVEAYEDAEHAAREGS